MRGFFFGVIFGALAAVMMAPRRGEETREIVRARVDLWQDQMMVKLEQARGDVETLRRDMMARFDEMRGQMMSRTTEEMKIRTERPAGPGEQKAEGPGAGA